MLASKCFPHPATPFFLQKSLLFLFIFLGPLGTLPTPACFPSPFRFYYFLLPLFFLFIPLFSPKQIRYLLFISPLLVYSFISVLYVSLYGDPQEEYPFFRFCLFVCHLGFVIGGSAIPLEKEEKQVIYKLYLFSFSLSLAFGYFMYTGYFFHLLPLPFLERFTILTQFGYGMLRFSPGSYPNEYGVVCSFVLSLFTLFLFSPFEERRTWKKRTILLLFPLITLALLLTTTRAAYLSYLFSLFYIAYQRKWTKKLLSIFALSSLGLILLVSFVDIPLFRIFSLKIQIQNLETGSLHERISYWEETLRKFIETPWVGLGFASFTNLHNVYLQLLVELGILGVVLLGLTLLLFQMDRSSFTEKNKVLSLTEKSILAIALLHVLWFALSNHNLNHHLTWFTLYLYFLYTPYNRTDSHALSQKTPAPSSDVLASDNSYYSHKK